MPVIRPAFYDAFRCKADRCGHSCCRGWEIDIDEDTAAYYLSLPGALGKELSAAIVSGKDGYSFRLTEEERCPFLRPDGLCRLIRELGEESLCDICALHPRFYQECGDFELWGLGLSCEAVCELVLESPEPLMFLPEDSEKPLSFSALLSLIGLAAETGVTSFIPSPRPEYYRAILRLFAGTEPIDPAWTERLCRLKAEPDTLYRAAWSYRETYDRGRYDRVYQYILYRQLEKADTLGLAALCRYARLSTEFVFMQDALDGDTAEHLRRWSEQIEYSTENVDIILNASVGSL